MGDGLVAHKDDKDEVEDIKEAMEDEEKGDGVEHVENDDWEDDERRDGVVVGVKDVPQNGREEGIREEDVAMVDMEDD